MNLLEYQAKKILSTYGIIIPKGVVISRYKQLSPALDKLGNGHWAIKAQVHTGGRGKAGGIKITAKTEEAVEAVHSLLGKELATKQTTGTSIKIKKLLVEKAEIITRELYLSATWDRSQSKPVLIASAAGGVDIEETAKNHPEKIIKCYFDPLAGLASYQGREVALRLGINNASLAKAATVFTSVCTAFLSNDATLVEINPLAVTANGDIVALDAKISLDDSALYRHHNLLQFNRNSSLNHLERKAQEIKISYIKLNGNIGCLVNGAGLAMATMDIIKLAGGEPANFLDVGGGASMEQVETACKILLSDTNVKAILINIFGGIMKCDIIAGALVSAARNIKFKVPLVVRLEGTRVEEGKRILADSGLALNTANDLAEAAKMAVESAKTNVE